jgi:HAD superfamily hydrolase (TIGR01509 family)
MLPRGVLFDLDGTITEPMLDFPRIKAEMGIGDRPILETLCELPEDQRKSAQEVLERHELAAAEQSRLNPGLRELLHWLNASQIRFGVVTRNSLRCARIVFRRHSLICDTLITREEGVIKPDPQPLFRACDRLNIAPADAWMIGDGQYDVEAGLAAGMRTVWLSHDRPKHFAAEPWQTVSDLLEVIELLEISA